MAKINNLEMIVINGLIEMATTTVDELLTEYVIVASQRLENNLQLISFLRKLVLYPEMCTNLKAITKLSHSKIEMICKKNYIHPTNPQDIITLDHAIAKLLKPTIDEENLRSSLDLGVLKLDKNNMNTLKNENAELKRTIQILKSQRTLLIRF